MNFKKVICFLLSVLMLASVFAFGGCKKKTEEMGNGDSSSFDPEDWTGEESDIPKDSKTYEPAEYVIPVRQEGETDDSPAIKRALDQIKETGGTIYFPESSYLISEPIVVYKNITYVGRGVNQTKITVAKGANCDAFVSDNFDSYCDQKNYDKIVSAYFGPNSPLPQNFEIKGLTIDGNANFVEDENAKKTNVYKATGNTEGYGIKLFAKRYIIENVQIQNVAQVGFYTEFNAEEVTGVDNSYDYFICTTIEGLRVISTGEEGLIYRGPSDQEIDGLWVCASCLTGATSVYQGRSNWELSAVVFEDKEASGGNLPYCASPELGFAHIWRGFNCWGMVLLGQLRFKADHLIIESTNGGLKTSTLAYSQISILDIHNCMYGTSSRPYLWLRSTTHTKISNLEMRYGYDKTKKDMIWVTGQNVTIGQCQLRANKDIVGTAAGGHGLVLKEGSNFVQVSGLNAMQFGGKGSDGRTTASAIVIERSSTRNRIEGIIQRCSVGATVYEGNNTVNLSTRTDTKNGEVAIVATDSVLKTLQLTIVDWNAEGSKWTQFPNNVTSNSIDANSTDVQTITVPHGCTIKPLLEMISVTLTNSAGLDDFEVGFVSVVSADEQNVVVKVKLTKGSTVSDATLGINLQIG